MISRQTELVNLNSLKEEILEAHRECQIAMTASLEKAARIGRLLAVAKSNVPHGQWGAWVEDNCEFSMRTAQGYMRVNREMPTLAKAQPVALLGFREALNIVADSRHPDIPLPKPGQHLFIVDRGEQAALMVIPHETVKRYYITAIDLTEAERDSYNWANERPVTAAGLPLFVREFFPQFDLSRCEFRQMDGEPDRSFFDDPPAPPESYMDHVVKPSPNLVG